MHSIHSKLLHRASVAALVAAGAVAPAFAGVKVITRPTATSGVTVIQTVATPVSPVVVTVSSQCTCSSNTGTTVSPC